MSATSEMLHKQIVLLDEALAVLRANGGTDGQIAQMEQDRAYYAQKLQASQAALTEGKGVQLLKG